MKKNNVRICPLCKQKIVCYKHTLSRIIVKGLYSLHKAGGRAKLDKLGLSNSEFTNFQKLRYFGLALNSKSSCEWFITSKGYSFLEGRIKINMAAYTENGRVVRLSRKKIFITQVKNGGQFKIEWREQAMIPGLFDI